MSGDAVGTSTSPLWYQSNSRPMVLSSLAMNPSSDIVAAAITVPMAGLPPCTSVDSRLTSPRSAVTNDVPVRGRRHRPAGQRGLHQRQDQQRA